MVLARKVLLSYRVGLGAGILLMFLLVAIFAPLLAPHDPTIINPKERLQGPSKVHLLGTDDLGRDVLSRIIFGTRLTFKVAVPAVVLAAGIGIPFGLVAGYYRGIAEIILMRITEMMLALPPIILGIFAVAFLKASVTSIVIVIGVLYTPAFARVVYGSTLAKREETFIEAAHALGASDGWILFRLILPNITAPILVQASITMGMAILLESSLSFLGLGPPPPDPSWGRMVSQARPFMHFQPWFIVWPSLVIALAIIATNLLGDGLRDMLDPRLQGRNDTGTS